MEVTATDLKELGSIISGKQGSNIDELKRRWAEVHWPKEDQREVWAKITQALWAHTEPID